MFIFRFIATLPRAIWHGLNTLRRILHLILLLALFAGDIRAVFCENLESFL